MQVSSVELEPISHALNWESELVELNGLYLLHTDNIVRNLAALKELDNKCPILALINNRRSNKKDTGFQSLLF